MPMSLSLIPTSSKDPVEHDSINFWHLVYHKQLVNNSLHKGSQVWHLIIYSQLQVCLSRDSKLTSSIIPPHWSCKSVKYMYANSKAIQFSPPCLSPWKRCTSAICLFTVRHCKLGWVTLVWSVNSKGLFMCWGMRHWNCARQDSVTKTDLHWYSKEIELETTGCFTKKRDWKFWPQLKVLLGEERFILRNGS